MDDVELANLVANLSEGPVEIGRLEDSLADSIRAGTNRMVLLSGFTFDKERIFHPDIQFDDYPLISKTLRAGYAVTNPTRPLHLVMGYYDKDINKKPYKLVLKATKNDSGIHVQTFHRIDRSEFGRLLRQANKRGRIVRNPYPEMIRR